MQETIVSTGSARCGAFCDEKTLILTEKYNAHLMPRVGVVSKDKYRFSMTTCNPRGPDTGLGLVGCVSQTPEPYRVWGADINSVRSRGGCVYKIFVTEVSQVLFRLSRWENLDHAQKI